MELTPRAILVSSASASSILRGMAARHPTVGLDEVHNIFADRNKSSDLAAIANCGYAGCGPKTSIAA